MSFSQWDFQNEGKNIWYTKKVGSSRISVFAIVLEYPFDTNKVVLKQIANYMDSASRVTMLGFKNMIEVI